MDKLYSKYFQKSRSFLYPCLGIKKASYISPSGTYISIEGFIGADEAKLICTFKNDKSDGFKSFENQMLLSNPLFETKYQIKDYNVYVFSLEIYKSDFFNFLLGKYSKLSTVLKKAIKSYYGDNSAEYKFIETYLNPEKYFESYAKLLNVDLELLKQVGELCDACDLDKETLKISTEDLKLLKEKSVAL
jgi:hypothetical protein